MIHSLAGGKIREMEIQDFAKVEIIEGLEEGKIFWYISPFLQLKIGDFVLVPLGRSNAPTRAKVLKIEKNLSAQVAPVPISRAKQIIKILNEKEPNF